MPTDSKRGAADGQAAIKRGRGAPRRNQRRKTSPPGRREGGIGSPCSGVVELKKSLGQKFGVVLLKKL